MRPRPIMRGMRPPARTCSATRAGGRGGVRGCRGLTGVVVAQACLARLIEEDVGLEREGAQRLAGAVRLGDPLVRVDLDHIAHLELAHIHLDRQSARVLHRVEEDGCDLACARARRPEQADRTGYMGGPCAQGSTVGADSAVRLRCRGRRPFCWARRECLRPCTTVPSWSPTCATSPCPRRRQHTRAGSP